MDENKELVSCLDGSYHGRMPLALLLVAALTPSALVTVTPRPCGVIVTAPSTTTVPVATCPPPGAGAADTVTIRMYDRGTARAGQRLQARTVSDVALNAAGLRPVWRVCGGVGSDTSDSGTCADPLGTRELIVRFEDAPRHTPPDVLGFAYVPGVVATVLVDRVREMARRSDTSIGELLGGVMAHELMHLLRASRGHESGGLMRATWSDDDVRHGKIWSLQLTPSLRDSALLN